MNTRAYLLVSGEPWAILPDVVPGYLEIVARERARVESAGVPDGDISAVNAAADKSSRRNHEPSVRDGVMEIPVRGPILRYANLMHDVCGGASVQSLASSLRAGVADPNVRAILFHFDSPGGQASGIGELARQIREASKSKPVAAYVGNMACSAAYWLAAACPRVVVAPAATLGSIGAILQVDSSKPKDVITFVSSQSPLKHADPSKKDGAGEIQSWVDDLAAVFVGDVAALRGVDPAKVTGDFGRGGVMVGSRAVACGMADALGDFETVLGRLSRGEDACGTTRPAPKKAAPPKSAGAGPKPTARTATGGPMNLKRLLGLVKETNPEAAAALALAAAEMGDDAAPAPAPAAGPARNESGETPEQVKARVRAEVESEQRDGMKAFYAEEASAWLDRQVEAGTVVPADRDALSARFVDAAMTDRLSGPLAYTLAGQAKTVSRLGSLKAEVEGRVKNSKTVETVRESDGSAGGKLEGFNILPAASTPDNDKASAEMVLALLGATEAGRAARAELAAK